MKFAVSRSVHPFFASLLIVYHKDNIHVIPFSKNVWERHI